MAGKMACLGLVILSSAIVVEGFGHRLMPLQRSQSSSQSACLSGLRATASNIPSTDISQATPVSIPQRCKVLRGQIAGSFRESAQVVEVDVPEPAEGQVLIKVQYAGINGGCETFRARGDFSFEGNKAATDGFSMGAEGAGVVHKLGPGVEGLQVGDPVVFVGGAFAEYVCASVPLVNKVKAATPEMVATRISGCTGCGAINGLADAKKGEVVLITAGAGAAGSFAVQFAKAKGCTVIATCSNKEKAVALCKLGADHIINYKTRDVDEVLKQKFPKGLDVVVEHVGGKIMQTGLNNLKPDGRMVVIGYISQYPHNPNAADEADAVEIDLPDMFWGGKTIQRGQQTIYGRIYPGMESVKECRQKTFDMVDNGEIVALVDKRSEEFQTIESIPDALDYFLTGQAIGKVVVAL